MMLLAIFEPGVDGQPRARPRRRASGCCVVAVFLLCVWVVGTIGLNRAIRGAVARRLGCDVARVQTSTLWPHVWWGPTLVPMQHFVIAPGPDGLSGTVITGRNLFEPYLLSLPLLGVPAGGLSSPEDAVAESRRFIQRYWRADAPIVREARAVGGHRWLHVVLSPASQSDVEFDMAIYDGTPPAVVAQRHAHGGGRR